MIELGTINFIEKFSPIFRSPNLQKKAI